METLNRSSMRVSAKDQQKPASNQNQDMHPFYLASKSSALASSKKPTATI